MNKKLTFLLSLTFLVLFSCSVYGGVLEDFQSGLDAHQRKDYKEAVRLILPIAEQGYAEAQNNLGWMRNHGQGIPQDFKEAVKWYRLSAEQGNAKAQLNLGWLYDNGQGVLQDYALAHMWFNLCGSSGDQACVGNRSIIEKKMSPSQVEKAQEMAKNWKPTKK
jgi:TPR repeat protein